jgi:hypothetical protein
MNGLVKSGIVLAGYVTAVLAANAAVDYRLLHTQGEDAQASAGMYAFGDALLFLAVFAVVAVLPTGLALYFLRPYRLFWTALSLTALSLAATGLLAAAVYVLASFQAPPGSRWELWAAFAVLRMLAAPPLATAFALAGLIAPNRTSRWSLLVAAAIEGAVAAYAILHWCAPYRLT